LFISLNFAFYLIVCLFFSLGNVHWHWS